MLQWAIQQLGGHNFGVAAENFHNIFNKLNKQDFSSYKYIIYGFTPNDLFDLVDGELQYGPRKSYALSKEFDEIFIKFDQNS